MGVLDSVPRIHDLSSNPWNVCVCRVNNQYLERQLGAQTPQHILLHCVSIVVLKSEWPLFAFSLCRVGVRMGQVNIQMNGFTLANPYSHLS